MKKVKINYSNSSCFIKGLLD